MRLADGVAQELVEATESYLNGVPARLLLFGSRVDDSLRGGDIDLALVVLNTEDFDRLSQDSYKLVARMKMQMQDEERIDLIVTTPGRIVADPFQKQALALAVQLGSWPKD